MTRPALIQVFVRSLFIQASFNYWRMQNLGFAFCMIPIIRRLSRERKDVADRLGRHLGRFHTHPCLAPSILGSVVRIEETEDGASAGSEAIALKESLMGPYAALGDPLFWGALRPLAAVSGVLLGVVGGAAAPWGLLGLYNLPSGWIRWRGFQEGYRRGRWAFEFFQTLNLTRWTTLIRWIGLAALALLGAVLVKHFLPREGLFSAPVAYAPALAALMAVSWLIHRGVPRLWIPYGLFVLFLFVQVWS